MKHPNPLMLLRMAQADAYGAFAEHATENERLTLLRMDRYWIPDSHPARAPRYGDDTQMSVANAEVLIQTRPPYTSEQFASAYLRTFKRDPRPSYSAWLQQTLEEVDTTEELIARIDQGASEKNGACMRAPVLGVLETPEQVLKIARIQAMATHRTPMGILSAQSIALMSHFALYTDEPFDRLEEFCRGYLPDYHFETPWQGPVPRAPAFSTVHAVHTLLTTCESLLDLLRRVILFGGDTDTVGAIAWAIASTRMTEELPAFFEDTLEIDSPYGVAFLKEVGTSLMRRTASDG